MLSIIIVNYHSSEDILNCLKSAFVYPSAKDFEWIVVDNDSKDQSQSIIQTAFPFVRWIEMGYNAGFARANNKGIQEANGEILLLLNPDTLVIDDCIATCLHKFILSDYVACGVQQYFADGSLQASGNYFMKGGLNHLLPLPYLGNILRWVAFKMNAKKTNVPKASSVQEVDWISGAFLMVKRSAIQKVGKMDEDFFLYAEEVEWCSRLGNVGKLCIYGDIALTHICGKTINNITQTSNESYSNIYDKKGLQLLVSNHLRIRKQYGIGWFFFQLIMHTFGVFIFFVGSLIENIICLRNPFLNIKNILGLAANICTLWSISPRIVRNKPYFYKMF